MKKTIIICGGSRGIGKASTEILLKKNYHVVVISRTLGELNQDLISFDNFMHLPCDLSDENQRKQTLEKILTIENLWGLVNNTSGPATGPLELTSLKEFRNSFESHLYASHEFSQALIPILKNKNEGRIVNIISVTAKVPLENMGVSNTIRGAMLNWSKTLSKELGTSNITVNNVLPGYTETQRLDEVIKTNSKKFDVSPDELRQRILQQVPMKRFAKAEEVAAAVCFYLSEEASFITGTSLAVDGGWTSCN